MKKFLYNKLFSSNIYNKCFCLIIVFCLIISSISITTYATSNEETNSTVVSAQHINMLKNKILTKTESFEKTHYKETIENVSLFKKAILNSYPKISNYDLGKQILMALGDSEDFIDSLPIDKVIEAVNYTSVIRTDIYLKEAANGELIEISKEQFYSPNSDASVCATTSNYYNREETFGDIIIRSTAYERVPDYALNGRSYFSIRGEVIWDGYPNFQMNDLLVISSTGNIDNNYPHYAFGSWTHSLNGTITDIAYLYEEHGGDGDSISLSNPSLYGMGAEFPLGIGQQGQFVIDRVYAYYGVSAQRDITCQVSYAHAIIAWNPSFSISSSGSISFGGIGLQRQVFNAAAFTLYHN